jgi:hypothetical protein
LDALTIVCSAVRSGAPCGATAKVLIAHYVYKPKHGGGRDGPQEELAEIRYSISCPKCGQRTQVETPA